MAEIIRMPRLSDTMTEGVIAEWKKNVGDKVEKGDVLAEIQTDKATMELESYHSGYLLYKAENNNRPIPVDDLLAIIGEHGEDIRSLLEKEASNPPLKEKSDESASSSSNEVPKEEPAAATNIDLDDSIVAMPRLSDTMEQGTILKWYKSVGDSVAKGDLLAEVETDKATMDLESFKSGVMLYIGVKAGESANVEDLLCIIGDKNLNIDNILASFQSAKKPQTQNAPSSPEAKPASSSQNLSENAAADNHIKSSPLARKMAKENSLSLSQLKGSGDYGRIIKRDIEIYISNKGNAVASQSAQPIPAQTPASQPLGVEEGFVDIPLSQMRSIIAKRLQESKREIPHFYIKMEVTMDNVIKQRVALNEISPVKVSFNDIIIKAAAAALALHPEVNASWMGNAIRQYKHIHIGSAVAIPDGLVVPVIKHASLKGLAAIAAETKELYKKAKEKKLQPKDFSGGTFTISNLGMMDVDDFAAIINPPESCILAVGRIKEVVTHKNGSFGVENKMTLTLSADHRVADGAVAAAFLQTLKKLLENPLSILI